MIKIDKLLEIRDKIKHITINSPLTDSIDKYVEAIEKNQWVTSLKLRNQILLSHNYKFFNNNEKELFKHLFMYGKELLKINIKRNELKIKYGEDFYKTIENFKYFSLLYSKEYIKNGNINWILEKKSTFDIDEVQAIIFLSCSNIPDELDIIDTKQFKYESEWKDFLSFIEQSKNKMTIIITEDFDRAKKIFGNVCMFNANFNDIDKDKRKKLFIRNSLKNNKLTISNNNINQLINKNEEELDQLLARASINAIKNNRTKILKEDLKINKKSKYKEELDKLIGLDDIKNQLTKYINYLEIAKRRNDIPSLSMVFSGNPGTGKTTIAKIYGQILSEKNILSPESKFILASRETIVGRVIGRTEENLMELIKQATGGILFIDEAYSLTSDSSDSRDFGMRAMEVLINQMEIHKNDICFIFAGYPKEMNEFIKVNPGLDSRIPFKLNFKDYSNEDLVKIFKSMIKHRKFTISSNIDNLLIEYFNYQKNRPNFGNARIVRNLVERSLIEQANRIINSGYGNENILEKCDIEGAIDEIKSNDLEDCKTQIGFSI